VGWSLGQLCKLGVAIHASSTYLLLSGPSACPLVIRRASVGDWARRAGLELCVAGSRTLGTVSTVGRMGVGGHCLLPSQSSFPSPCPSLDHPSFIASRVMPVSSEEKSLISDPKGWYSPTVDRDDILECDTEFVDSDEATLVYEERLLRLSEKRCLGEFDFGLVESSSWCSVGDEGQYIAGIAACDDVSWRVFVSRARGSEYPPASQGVLLRLWARDSLVLLDGVFSSEGVVAALDGPELPPIAECAAGSTVSLISTLAICDEFNKDVTSIVSQTTRTLMAKPSHSFSDSLHLSPGRLSFKADSRIQSLRSWCSSRTQNLRIVPLQTASRLIIRDPIIPKRTSGSKTVHRSWMPLRTVSVRIVLTRLQNLYRIIEVDADSSQQWR